MVYAKALGAEVIRQEEIPGRKRSLYFAVGEDTVVEAAQPLSPTTPEGNELARASEGIFSVTFKTRNLKRAGDYLRSKGQKFTEDGDSLVLDSDQAFGMTVGFTESNLRLGR